MLYQASDTIKITESLRNIHAKNKLHIRNKSVVSVHNYYTRLPFSGQMKDEFEVSEIWYSQSDFTLLQVYYVRRF